VSDMSERILSRDSKWNYWVTIQLKMEAELCRQQTTERNRNGISQNFVSWKRQQFVLYRSFMCLFKRVVAFHFELIKTYVRITLTVDTWADCAALERTPDAKHVPATGRQQRYQQQEIVLLFKFVNKIILPVLCSIVSAPILAIMYHL
jgi:hypothetical protein